MIWSIPTMWQFPELFLMFCQWRAMSRLPKSRVNQYFLRSGLWAWWATLAYQVMLTIRGRLITPFILGSMSVGLNILIRHSFVDLWVWRLRYHDRNYFLFEPQRLCCWPFHCEISVAHPLRLCISDFLRALLGLASCIVMLDVIQTVRALGGLHLEIVAFPASLL